MSLCKLKTSAISFRELLFYHYHPVSFDVYSVFFVYFSAHF